MNSGIVRALIKIRKSKNTDLYGLLCFKNIITIPKSDGMVRCWGTIIDLLYPLNKGSIGFTFKAGSSSSVNECCLLCFDSFGIKIEF